MKDTSISFVQTLYYFKIACLIIIPILFFWIFFYFKKLKIISKKVTSVKNWFGVNPLLNSSSKSKREWEEIDDLLEESYQSSWKLAVIKSEALIENFLKQLGYQGKSFEELLEALKLRKYRNLDILRGVHQVCEEILTNKDYSCSQAEAKNIVVIYKKFWQEVLDNVI
jgi:hypothetical protein